MFHRTFLAAALAVALLGASSVAAQSPTRGAHPAAGRHWVGTWAVSPQGALASFAPPVQVFNHRTIRQVVRISMGP